MSLKRIEKECEGECPKCGSGNINWHGSEDIDDGRVYDAECDDCQCVFTEEYNLKYCVSVIEED